MIHKNHQLPDSVWLPFLNFFLIQIAWFKSWVLCFSMQVVINKCFLQNPEKKLAQFCLVLIKKKQKMHTLIPKK